MKRHFKRTFHHLNYKNSMHLFKLQFILPFIFNFTRSSDLFITYVQETEVGVLRKRGNAAVVPVRIWFRKLARDVRPLSTLCRHLVSNFEWISVVWLLMLHILAISLPSFPAGCITRSGCVEGNSKIAPQRWDQLLPEFHRTSHRDAPRDRVKNALRNASQVIFTPQIFSDEISLERKIDSQVVVRNRVTFCSYRVNSSMPSTDIFSRNWRMNSMYLSVSLEQIHSNRLKLPPVDQEPTVGLMFTFVIPNGDISTIASSERSLVFRVRFN